MSTMRFYHWLYRLALVFCFLGFGLWEIVKPSYWMGYAPDFASKLGDVSLLIRVHGVALTAIALGVLWGRYRVLFTGLAVLVLIEILVTVWFAAGGFGETFIRDVTIFLFALGLHAQAHAEEK